MNDLMTYLQASLLCQLHARFQQHMGLSWCTRCFLMLGFGPRLGFGLRSLTAKRVHTVRCNLPARYNVCLRRRRRRRRPGGGCAGTGVFVPLSCSFSGPAITCLAARYSVCRPTAGRPGGGWVCDNCVVRPQSLSQAKRLQVFIPRSHGHILMFMASLRLLRPRAHRRLSIVADMDDVIIVGPFELKPKVVTSPYNVCTNGNTTQF